MSTDDPFAHNPFAAPESLSYAIERQEGRLEYAGFLLRLGAAIIDGILMNILGAGIGLAIGIAMEGSEAAQFVAQLVGIITGWLYAVLMESSDSQGTLGKMAVGIRVADLDGQRVSFGRATGRHFSKIPSACILMVGFLMPLWTEKKQALHDMMAGCVIVKK